MYKWTPAGVINVILLSIGKTYLSMRLNIPTEKTNNNGPK
jgi:hypothetical protein